MKIEKLKYYHSNASNSIDIVTAVINGEYHITGDIRKRNDKRIAVFSDITKFNKLKQSSQDLIDMGVYQPIYIEMTNVINDYYIWVGFEFKNKKQ